MIVSASSMSGKTFWTLKLLRQLDTLFEKVPEKVFFFYNNYNDSFSGEGLGHVSFIKGLPESIEDIPKGSLIILDDFMLGKRQEILFATLCAA